MFPKRGDASVGQGIVAVSLVFLVQRNERVVAVCLFHPLHSVAGIGQNFFAGLTDILGSLGVEGPIGLISLIGHIGLICPIQINKVDRSEGAVFPDLTNHTSNTITVIGVVLLVKGYTIVANGIELSTLRYIPTYTLMHDGYQVVGLLRTVRLLETFRHHQLRKQNLQVGPCVAVLGGLQHGARGGHMLILRVTEEVHIELVVPVGHHGLVVIGPPVVVGCCRVLTIGS